MAQRVINARPFSSLDDLSRVSGFGGTGQHLQDVKDQGLACVQNENIYSNTTNHSNVTNNPDNQNQTNSSVIPNNSFNNTSSSKTSTVQTPPSAVVSSYQSSSQGPLTLQTINLNDSNTSSIEKEQQNNASKDLNKNLVYALIVFGICIIALLLIKNWRRKNEF